MQMSERISSETLRDEQKAKAVKLGNEVKTPRSRRDRAEIAPRSRRDRAEIATRGAHRPRVIHVSPPVHVAQVQNSIRDERLVPAVRTVYRRCAFQSSHSNAVRLITSDYIRVYV